MNGLIRIAESGYLPDPLLRAGIRYLVRERLLDERRRDPGIERNARFADRLRHEPIAVDTETANDQHYELPAEFFRLMLGPRLKYSSCHWSPTIDTLEEAEAEMLRLSCERAGIEDGMSILDLGCGWGSLSLWIAERFPGCRVTAVSNSRRQTEFIDRRAAALGVSTLSAVTDDMNRFAPAGRFDRVVSVEMFEHMRNHGALLSRIAGWLDDGGALFVHLFCHREIPYLYETDGDHDWMARHFFTGGMMPSLDLLRCFDRDLQVSRQWIVDGSHYRRTLLAWLRNLDARRIDALRILEDHYTARESRRWFVRWRLFLLACAELFGFAGGREWMVAHYLLERPA